MSRRKRLSWYERERLASPARTRNRRRRLSRRRKMADPYSMNQDHRQPAIDAYQTGDPSAWAEGIHRGYPRDEEVGRNEIGLPNPSPWHHNHRDLETWGGEGPYDNSDTFTAEDFAWNDRRRDRRQNHQEREASRRIYANIEKKAFQCVRIAAELLPEADEQEIEDQAFDLMNLPDDVVVATILRIAEHKLEEKEGEEEEDLEVEAMLRQMLAEEEEDDEEEEETKVASALRRILAEIEEEAEEEDDEEEEDEEEEDVEEEAKVASALRRLIAEELEEAEEEDDEEEEEAKVASALRRILAEIEEEAEEEDDEEEEETKVASALRRILAEIEEEDEEDEDAEVEAMIREMMALEEDEDDFDALEAEEEVEEDFEVELDPTLDEVDSDSDQKDAVLRGLFANTVPQGARRKRRATSSNRNSRGVRSLGGRVKEATSREGDVDLSKLWASDPDVSDIF